MTLPEQVDLGNGCRLQAYRWCMHEPRHHCWQALPDEPAECSCGNTDNCPESTIVGWAFIHPWEAYTGGECFGLIYVRDPFGNSERPVPVWTVVQEEPLTITPSVNCVGHPPWHGFITEGRWIPC